MTSDLNEAMAKARYLRMSISRILGMVLVVLGLQIWLKGAFGYQDELAGKLIAIAGVACMFLVPALLRRRWRESDSR